MLHSGEQAHWPDVDAACTKLESLDPDTNKDAHCMHAARALHARCSHARCPHAQAREHALQAQHSH